MAEPVPLPPHKTVYLSQGDFRRLRFTILDGTGAVKDLTGIVSGATWDLYLGRSVASLLPKTLGMGIAVSDAAAGQVTVTIDDAETAGIVSGYYMDELRLEYVTGEAETVAFGPIIIRDRRVGEAPPI